MPCRSDSYEGFTPQPPRPDLTPLLCSACRALEKLEFDFATNPELDKWWHTHEEADTTRRLKEAKDRLERESAIEIANTKKLSELTQDDKQLLKKWKLL